MVKKHSKKKKKKLKGSASMYITRKHAVRKLQISLRTFRKLCILKGIFPREPKNKYKGKDKTYYYAKDIAYLAHEPIISKLRQLKIWKKKMKKCVAKKEYEVVKRIKRSKPTYNLDHILRERYPTFIDALRGIDDALSTIHLFAILPQNKYVSAQQIAMCQRLCKEFQSYVAITHSLRKVFVSIKGFYYQAEIYGQLITWLSPFRFPQSTPDDVDWRVMLSFLELYEKLLGFVNFKLYHDLGYHYPPPLDRALEAEAAGLSSVILKPTKSSGLLEHSKKKKRLERLERQLNEFVVDDVQDVQVNRALMKVETIEGGEDTVQELERKKEAEMREVFKENTPTEGARKECASLFENCVFYLSREVPQESLEFVIKSFGGTICRDEKSESITHEIVDRPSQGHKFLSREYVQPQWVYDSANSRICLPVHEYLPGLKLPPHLSPFVNDQRVGYLPERREQLQQLIATAKGLPPKQEKRKGKSKDEDLLDSEEEAEEEAAEIEQLYERELQQEAGIIPESSESDQQSETSLEKRRRLRLEEKKRQQLHFQEIMIPSRKKQNRYFRKKLIQKKKIQSIKKLQRKRKMVQKSKETSEEQTNSQHTKKQKTR